jgi:hypothetical protein
VDYLKLEKFIKGLSRQRRVKMICRVFKRKHSLDRDRIILWEGQKLWTTFATRPCNFRVSWLCSSSLLFSLLYASTMH